MAQARLTCGACGAPLTVQDSVCPNCGSPVELPGTLEQRPVEAPRAGRSPGEGRQPQARHNPTPGRKAGEGKSPSPRPPVKPAAVTTRRDPWPYVALIAIVALLAVVIYTQWGHTPAQGPVSGQAPASGQIPSAASPQIPNPTLLFQLEQAAQAKPNDPDARIRLANAQHDAGQFGSAVENYRKYLQLHPDDPDARVDMGICLYQMGLTDSAKAVPLFRSAVQEMRTAAAANPGHQPAAFNLGIVYLQLGNLDSSNIWFRRAVALNKTSDLGTRAQRILEQHQLAQ
ncbi:MAG TPA: tetratricopeptide repeat protein [Bacteroidota bacterium]